MIQIIGGINDDVEALYFNLLELHLSRANILNNRLHVSDRMMGFDYNGGSVLASYSAFRTKLDNTRRSFVVIKRVDTIVRGLR